MLKSEGLGGMKDNMKLIVGLGNPGNQYTKTKHNIGFMSVDNIAQKLSLTFNQTKFKSLYTEGRMGTEKFILIKPQTYMNLSGEAVQAWVDFYKLSGADIVVIYDDMDLPIGKVRLRAKGGHGGHNGVKSIIQHLGTKEFNRVRVGIGRPFVGQDVTSHVLSQFPKKNLEEIDTALYQIEDAINYWLDEHTFLETMNEFN